MSFEQEITRLYADTTKTTIEAAEKYIKTFKKAYKQETVQAVTLTGKYSGMTPAGAQRMLRAWLTRQMDTPAWHRIRREIASKLSSAEALAAQRSRSILFKVMADSVAAELKVLVNGAKKAGIHANWHIYDRRAVERLATANRQMLPVVGVKLTASGEYYERQIQKTIQSGIIRGVEIDRLADELDKVTAMGKNSSMRAIRTAMTGARGAGAQIAMDEAHDKYGLEMEKEWIAATDARVRDSHADLDGERVPYNKPFSNGLMYPGDPTGAPGEVWNCRCTMKAIFKGINDK